MTLIVDEVMLREPNLLIPGKKPVGPVKIDWSHPLAPKLFCAVPTQQNIAELVHSVLPTLGGEAYISHRGVETPGTGWDDSVFYPMPFIVPDKNFTIMTGFVNTSASYNYESTMWFIDDNENRFISSDSGNKSKFFCNHRNAGISNGSLTVNFWEDGLDHTLSMTITPNPNSAYFDINISLDETYTVIADTRLIGGTALQTGVYVRSLGANNGSPTGYTKYFYMWDKALSTADRIAIKFDPYQFLIPA